MAIKKPKAPKGKNPQEKHKFIDWKLKKKEKKGKRSKNPNFIPLGGNPLIAKKNKKEKKEKEKGSESLTLVSTAPAAQQLRFFLHHFQSANGFKLSPLELEAFKGQRFILYLLQFTFFWGASLCFYEITVFLLEITCSELDIS